MFKENVAAPPLPGRLPSSRRAFGEEVLLPQPVAPSADLAVASTVASAAKDGGASVPAEGHAKKGVSDVVFGGGR